MHYGDLPPHIAQGLIVLRERIGAAKIPPSQLDESLNIATWNIRELGKKPRLDASIVYIAEILSQFDLIALVELRDNLGDLKLVMDRLGRNWRVVFSDFGVDPGANSERVGYLYDSRMVEFTGLAAEADAERRKTAGGEYLAEQDWWRAPYMASFRAGNFDFVVITAHIRWGESSKDRIGELTELRKWVTSRHKHKFAVDSDFIVMGDFNIPSREDPTYAALTGNGKELHIPPQLLGVKGTNLKATETYDQILHSPSGISRFSGAGGALNFLGEGWEALYPDASQRPASPAKFTYELSDHFPLWLQLRTDIIDERLQILAGG